MGTSKEPARPESREDAVGRSGARFPSERQRERLGAEPEFEEEPSEPAEATDLPVRSGARFPSAKALERIERAERKAAEKEAAKRAGNRGSPETEPERARKKSRSRVGGSGARFPSASALERYGDAEPGEAGETASTREAAGAGRSEDPGEAATVPTMAHVEVTGPRQAAPADERPSERAVPAIDTPGGNHEYADELYDPLEENRLRVRPYVITRGRTEARDDLAIETLVTVNPAGPWARDGNNADYQAVRRLCVEPRSVAEIAALLAVPLGVARVLLSDLLGADLVHVHTASAPDETGRPDFALMQRVLAGLHRL
ncbi:Protein of unknown function (DUF742) [Prauserella aidingensis]|uniref:DUF742 domain-containing protein n=1 Tax=Prauserella aidingensis TaxID=387890 RepID=UPI0020A5CC0A|nr:DUF742 domain-containing protein [Prauserella aidingensis]MCP2255679.1 Protein of unknown function (DUF742) [Prauserella aidingensis]